MEMVHVELFQLPVSLKTRLFECWTGPQEVYEISLCLFAVLALTALVGAKCG